MFIVKFLGGIGNQLYQYNFINYLKNKYPKAEIKVDYSYYEKDSIHGGFMLNGIKEHKAKHYISSLFKYMDDSSYTEDFNYFDDIIFEGYWQNIKFLDKSYFNFNDVFKGEINTESKEILTQIENSENSVSLHVRCGDYDNHPTFGNISTKNYYNNAIKKICTELENPVFFVFSNNIKWAQNNLIFHNHKVIYVNCNTKPDDAKWDLFLMSSCKNNIISNSSFSWWAQRFNSNLNKIVITPPYWINEKSACFYHNIPEIQTFRYMHAVSNLPDIKLPLNKNLTFIISLGDDIQDFYKLHRIISTIINHFEKIPNIIIYSLYNDTNLIEYTKEISKTCNISIIYQDKIDIKELKNIIETQYVLFTNVTYFFLINTYSIIDKYLGYDDKTLKFTFNNMNNDKIIINNQERELNTIYKTDAFFNINEVFNNDNSIFINENIAICKKEPVDLLIKKSFKSKVKKILILIIKTIIKN